MSVEELTSKIISQNGDINELNPLLKLAMSDHNQTALEALKALRIIFRFLMIKQKLFQPNQIKPTQVQTFLIKKWNVFLQLMIQKVNHHPQAVLPQLIACFVYSESNGSTLMKNQFFHQLIKTALSKDVGQTINELFISKYPDFGAVFFQSACEVVRAENIEGALEFLTTVDLNDEDQKTIFFINKEEPQKKVKISMECYKLLQFSSQLNLEDYVKLRKQSYSQFITIITRFIEKERQDLLLNFLRIINKHIVEQIENPLLLSNFIEHHFNSSEDLEIKVQTLQTLFVLIGKCQFNLDGFYQKLVDLVEKKEIFKFNRFLKLLTVATKSSKMPQSLHFNILKKCLRTSLHLKTHQQFWVICFVFNTIKRNQSLKKFIQRSNTDPIMDDQEMTSENSFLWELNNYANHWLPELRDIVSIFSEDLSNFDYMDLEQIADIDENSLIEMRFQKLPDLQLDLRNEIYFI